MRLSTEVSPAVGPVLDVMAVEPIGGGTAGEAAPAVAAQERAAHRGRDAAGASSDAERLAVRTIHDRDDSGIAAQPSGGLRRDGGAVLEFAASRPAVGEHFGFDMYDDFVPVRRKYRDIVRFEHPLGHPRQRIGTAHRARRPADERPTWDVGQERPDVFSPVGSDRGPSTGIGGCIGRGCVLSRRPSWDVLRRRPFVVPPRRGLLRRMGLHRRIECAQDARTHAAVTADWFETLSRVGSDHAASMSVREKSSPLNRSGSSAVFSERVREAVTEVQPGRMIALPEASPGYASRLHLFGRDGRAYDPGPLQECIQFVHRRLTAATFHDDGRLQHVDCRHPATRGDGNRGLVACRIGLAQENGEQCGAVDDHPGNPLSS